MLRFIAQWWLPIAFAAATFGVILTDGLMSAHAGVRISMLLIIGATCEVALIGAAMRHKPSTVPGFHWSFSIKGGKRYVRLTLREDWDAETTDAEREELRYRLYWSAEILGRLLNLAAEPDPQKIDLCDIAEVSPALKRAVASKEVTEPVAPGELCGLCSRGPTELTKANVSTELTLARGCVREAGAPREDVRVCVICARDAVPAMGGGVEALRSDDRAAAITANA